MLRIVKVLAVCGAGVCRNFQPLPADERRVFRTTIGVSFLALVLLTALFEVPPYLRYVSGVGVGHLDVIGAIALVPQALAVVSVPMAIMFAVAFGMGGRVSSQRLQLAIAGLALAGSIGFS